MSARREKYVWAFVRSSKELEKTGGIFRPFSYIIPKQTKGKIMIETEDLTPEQAAAGLARDLGARLSSRNMSFGTSGDLPLFKETLCFRFS